jgi:hypothetical protein
LLSVYTLPGKPLDDTYSKITKKVKRYSEDAFYVGHRPVSCQRVGAISGMNNNM